MQSVTSQQVPLSRTFTNKPQVRSGEHEVTWTENDKGSLEKLQGPLQGSGLLFVFLIRDR